MIGRKLSLVALLLLAAGRADAGTGFPANFSESMFAPGLTEVTGMRWAPDGSNRLFVTRQNGEVRIVANGVLLAAPFATVDPVLNWSECGLLGIAFDPNFTMNGYVYVFATVSNTEQQIIRYTAIGDTGMDKTVIIPNLPTVGDTHNGGGISIGPDGKLYWAIGDNRLTTGHDQDLTSLMCKVGRANLDGSVPNDNPFFDGPGPNNDYIWARGFRNPFTHTWQPGTGRLFVNDVGGHGEQIFDVGPGDHGGWDDYGGGYQPMGYMLPVFMVESAGKSGAAITGGIFYDATLYPAEYRGNYFIGDFEVPGRIMRARLDANNTLIEQTMFGTEIPNIVDIEVGPDGALYYASWNLGEVFRLDYLNSSQELVVAARNVDTHEGTSTALTVRLALPPAQDVTVSVAQVSGDSDLATSGGTSLTFTPTTWATPQFVMIAAAEDADTAEDRATFEVSSPGLTTQVISVRASDNDSQGLILSTTVLSVVEGTSGTFEVSLSNAPAADVTVAIARASGDADLEVSSGASLVFTAANHQTPQVVTISAAEDADQLQDDAAFSVSAPGAASRTVAVTAMDNEQSPPLFTTTPRTNAIIGIAYSYDANATGLPAPQFALDNAPAGMAIDTATGEVTWIPRALGDFSVTVLAQNGEPPDANQTFTITVVGDGAPQALLTQPLAGATVHGDIEFYGDGRDDAATVRAEFFVDDVLVYTDLTPGDHYHYGGTNGHTQQRLDTLAFSNGTHRFKMTVYDAKDQSGSEEVTATINNPGNNNNNADGGGGVPTDPPAEVTGTCACTGVRTGSHAGAIELLFALLLVHLCVRAGTGRRRRTARSPRKPYAAIINTDQGR